MIQFQCSVDSISHLTLYIFWILSIVHVIGYTKTEHIAWETVCIPFLRYNCGTGRHLHNGAK